MKTYNFIIILLIPMMLLVGCATSANNIQAIHVPPLKYKNYDCDQIEQKLKSVYRKVYVLSSVQNADANSDPVALASVLINPLFPVLFMSGGSHQADIAQLKGDIISLQSNAIDKECINALAFIQEQNEIIESYASNEKK